MSFGGWDTRTKAAGIVRVLGYTNPRCLCRLGGLGYMNLAAGIVRGLGHASPGCLHLLEPQLHETRLLVSLGGWVTRNGDVASSEGLVTTRNRPVGVVWVCNYAKRGCLHGLCAQLQPWKVSNAELWER